ncbi:Crp/Fnr family transcriptional regulator [Anaerobium acetethylicum]|uniref:cAMP-binding domain of CRP or a regulatory subunit of cAMP-dependent protein kinases n=1 Tax=Anaerobium acetethylicum TaxID=1619234 RepID=A0A1D3TTK7_9FIRM|nr:Crp/Fnr family transcriptional regulator [Anaerobium acetethylicum]SCP97271.1 cAMP-binding domain of CRP or a regulatory subunit of cAMP-dependent protein kinases [Anaerobium acetethylicum]
MDEFYPILAKCPLFKDIAEDEYKLLLSCINAFTKVYYNNEYVILTGDVVNYVGIVLKGSLEISKENPAGTRHILDFLGPSNIFSEVIVCTSERTSPVTVKAKEESKILFVPYERIIKTCGSSCSFHFKLIQNMMQILSDKNINLNKKIELLLIKGMRAKLAAYLLNESKKNRSLTFQIVPNRNELAEYLNVSRTSMCRELARMKDLGMLDYYQNSFKITSLDMLKESLAEE